MDEASAARAVELHLEEVDAPGPAAREAVGRAPQARERFPTEAHAGPEARARAPGLDLDHDQRLARGEDEVELGPAGVQAPREEAPAARAQGALDQALAGQGEGRIPRVEAPQREARGEARAQPGEEARAAVDARRGSPRAPVPGA